jgi:hypothetical protein
MSEPISILLPPPPQAKRAAPPPVEAPGDCSLLYGLVVRPNTSDTVSRPTKLTGTEAKNDVDDDPEVRVREIYTEELMTKIAIDA